MGRIKPHYNMQRVSEEEEGDDKQADRGGNRATALPRRLFLTNGKLEFTLRAIPRLKEEETQTKNKRERDRQ